MQKSFFVVQYPYHLLILPAKKWNITSALSLTYLHVRWSPVRFPRVTNAPDKKHLDKSVRRSPSQSEADLPQWSRNELYGTDLHWLLQSIWNDEITLSKKYALRQLRDGGIFQIPQSRRALSQQLPFRARIQRTYRGIHRILQLQAPSSDQPLSNSRCDGGILLQASYNQWRRKLIEL